MAATAMRRLAWRAMGMARRVPAGRDPACLVCKQIGASFAACNAAYAAFTNAATTRAGMVIADSGTNQVRWWASQAPGSKWVVDVKSPQQLQKLLEGSEKTPVVMDFYADWCQPCKTLSPMLEKAADEYKGSFMLAKIDVENEDLAPLSQQLKISSLPTLLTIHKGKAVPQSLIVGVPDPEKLRQYFVMVNSLAGGDGGEGNDTKPPRERVAEALSSLETIGSSEGGEIENLSSIFKEVLSDEASTEEDKATAMAGLASCALKRGEVADAAELIKHAESMCSSGTNKPAIINQVNAQLEFTSSEEESEDWSAMEKEVASSEDDLDVLHRYASALFAAGKSDMAIDVALRIVKLDKSWNEEAGRKLLLKFFDAMGHDTAAVRAARQRLSNIWYN